MATKPSSASNENRAGDAPSLPIKRYTPFKLSLQTLKALDYLALKKGFNRTMVAEIAIQRMAKEEGYQS